METCERTYRRTQKRAHMKKTMNRPTWRKGEEKWGSCVEGDVAGIMAGDTPPTLGQGHP